MGSCYASYNTYTALLWQKEVSDKSEKSEMCLLFALTSTEHRDILPNISLGRMSIFA